MRIALPNAALAAFSLALLGAGSALAELAVRRAEIASAASPSRVPEVTQRGRFLAPQAVSAVDISADGKFISVGTMAFSHDANVWQLAPDGTVMRPHSPQATGRRRGIWATSAPPRLPCAPGAAFSPP